MVNQIQVNPKRKKNLTFPTKIKVKPIHQDRIINTKTHFGKNYLPPTNFLITNSTCRSCNIHTTQYNTAKMDPFHENG